MDLPYKSNRRQIVGAICLSLIVLPSLADSFKADPELVARGRYVTLISGCNDCHTADYPLRDGQVPESEWLTGDSFGWRGPWGTTYGSNLRLFVAAMSEQEWIDAARTLRRRPPMPWFNLNQMEETDLRALYHFMRSLGEPGQPAPAALPPDVHPSTPHAEWRAGELAPSRDNDLDQ